MSRFLLLLLFAMASQARASWLHLCPDERGDARMPDGRPARIVVSGEPSMPACVTAEIGVDSAQVETVYPLPPGARPENTILLLGAVKDGRFAVSEYTLPPAQPQPEPPAPMPLHANLPLARKAGPRATWIWDAAQWQHDGGALLAWAREQGLGLLFITVPTAAGGVREPARLADFVRRAHRQRIAVWSVDGDPHMVTPSGQAAAVRLAQAYASYNRKVEAAARLDGIQFDIEPYLLDQYRLAPEAWDRRYLALAEALRAAAGTLHLDFVVPFWWSGREDLLAGLARAADGLTVMDYRTDRGQVCRFAAPFLDWAQATGRQVRIALEAGPIAAQTQRRYVRASGAGDLLLVPLGPQQVMVTLRQPAPGAQAWRLDGTRELDGSATTFHADMAGLRALLPALEADLSGWPSFGGMAVHGLR